MFMFVLPVGNSRICQEFMGVDDERYSRKESWTGNFYSEPLANSHATEDKCQQYQ